MQAVVIQLNGITYAECGGKSFEIPCGNDLDILGDFTGTPHSEGGVFQGYDITLKKSGEPTGDQIPLSRVVDKVNGRTLHILGTVAQLRTACTANAAAMPAVTVPIPVPTQLVCKNPVTNNYTYGWGVPSKTGGQTYSLAARFNSTYVTTTGLASLAAAVTYLNTNLAAAGTWSDAGGRLRLVSTVDNATVGVAFRVV